MAHTLVAAVRCELTIRKSRFIGCVEPVADRAAALVIVAGLRAQHPGAAHVCWALMAGGQSAAVDDGEPSGTAGRPMLEVLRHQGLEGVLATVVRYFGGVKLGAGGLVRAYTDCVAQALLHADKQPLVARQSLRCALPYAFEGLLRRTLDSHGANIDAVRHGDEVEVDLSLPAPAAADLVARLNEAGQGRIRWLADAETPPGMPAA